MDQFANLVLHQTIERIHVGQSYGDIPRGVFIVRGENVVLLGEIDTEKTEPGKLGLMEVSLEEILEKQAVQQQEKEEQDRIRWVLSNLNMKHINDLFQSQGIQRERADLHSRGKLRGHVLR